MRGESSVVTCVGLSHVTAPVELREKLAFSAQEVSGALPAFRAEIGGAVILSTCNRTELYATGLGDDAFGRRLIELLNGAKRTSVETSHFYVLHHDEAARHLFRVSAGVDSMILGESQILGQVREAMSVATDADTLNGVLSRVFHSAIAVGKRARTETKIGHHAVSVSSAAVSRWKAGRQEPRPERRLSSRRR
jgi:glutamyl-tRNA reductase